MKLPNNFPREGQHSTVTKNEVKRLQHERPALNTELHYTMGGETETVVHSNLMAEREAAITNGARRLQQLSNTLNQNFDVSKPDARTEYMRAQMSAARGPEEKKYRNPTR